ncbi:MAG TPA: hypothetical protein VEI97_18255, partial [bacterium]|nr:hypothetical protein [bacterium]
MMTALNGTYNPNQLPTNAPYWQFWQLLDYDWTTTPSVVEDWADAGALNGFTANLPSKNSSVDPAAAGTGVGKIDANRTVGFDYSHSADRLYVADDQDDSVEVYETLLNGSTDPAVAQEWVYLGISTAAGVLVDPVDIAVTANDFVVVLDKGGASGNYRLVALSGTDLTVVATRDLIVEGDIPAGAISISNDESLVNVNDPSAFVLLWDAPELPTTAPKGGMNWYTIDTTP